MVEHGDWHRYNPSPKELGRYLVDVYVPLYALGYCMRKEIHKTTMQVRYLLCPLVKKLVDEDWGGAPVLIVDKAVELEPYVKLLVGGEHGHKD